MIVAIISVTAVDNQYGYLRTPYNLHLTPMVVKRLFIGHVKFFGLGNNLFDKIQIIY